MTDTTKATTLAEALAKKLAHETDWLMSKEKLLLAYIDQKINSAYYNRWLKERNQLMKLCAELKKRHAAALLDENSDPSK